MRIRPSIRVSPIYFTVIAIWATCVCARLKFNGLVYGLDFGLYQPDGMYYTFKTLKFLGWSDNSAISEVTNWYLENSSKVQSLNFSSFNNPTSDPWLVTKFRFIYPLLSVPFVSLFGLSGMLAIPALSLLTFFLFVQKIANQNKTPTSGIVLILLLGTSPTLLRWTTVNYSDALILALFSVFAYITCTSREIWSIVNLSLIGFIIFLATFTRQTLPIWVLIGSYLFFTRNRSAGLVTFLVSLICSIPSLVTFPYAQYLTTKQAGNVFQSFFKFIGNAVYVNAIEVVQLLVLDRMLLIILLAAFYFAFKFRYEIYVHLFLLVTLGTVLTNSLVGVAGVNFRYLLPVLPFAILVILRSTAISSVDRSFSKSCFKN